MFKIIVLITSLLISSTIIAGEMLPAPGTVKKYVDPAPSSCIQKTERTDGSTGWKFLNTCNYPIGIHFHQINFPDPEYVTKINRGSKKGDYVGGFTLVANQTSPYLVSYDKKYGEIKFAYCVAGTPTNKPNDDSTQFKTKKGDYATNGVDGNAINSDLFKCWHSY